ncbi:MAG: FG-GAP-like repeat-containing protein [Pirellulales bacterium]
MPDTPPSTPKETRRRSVARLLVWCGIALFLVVAIVLPLALLTAPSPEQLLDEAQFALSLQDYETAERLATQVLVKDRQSLSALLILGDAAARQERWEDAVAYWDQIPDGSGPEGTAGLYAAGRVLLYELHRARQAELRFRRALNNDPDFVPALYELARLLGVEGRRWEAVPLFLELLRRGQVDVDQLALLGMPFGVISDPELLRACHTSDREDPTMLLGVAACTLYALDSPKIKLLLEEVVRTVPDLVDAQARLGSLLLEEGDAVEFVSWHDKLPEQAGDHPEIWAVRGAWALRHGQKRVAMRCYWETLRRDPNHRPALHQLGRLLIGSKDERGAAPIVTRGQQLHELRQSEDILFHTEHTSLEPIEAVAVKLESLGRVWEAWGWCQVALQMSPTEPWARESSERLSLILSQNPPQTLAISSPIAHLDLSAYPVPKWEVDGEQKIDAPGSASKATAFVENAADVGLDFVYFNNSHSASEGKRMYEFPGGGVGVIDYDADGWPDLYLTQGCRWPPDPNQREHLDRLFRNVGGNRFEDVTARAGVLEPSFSQGVTVGDYDSDGFADVYVANIGENRFFRNNGDGTFSDLSTFIETDSERWTTSCLLADVNGDGCPELYDVNYVEGSDVFDRICKHADGPPRMCMPFHFPGAQDQLHLNLGDGHFKEVTRVAGIEAFDGKGLGIVAGDFDGSGRLSLFIANDTTPNFFFVNETPARGEMPAYVDRALLMGLGLDANGRAEGSMGIAVGDANQNGLLDFYVGTFLGETNTLYVQNENSLFRDATREFHLTKPSVDLLAFGTQFIDADLDGDLDLIVTNGHVDDVRAYGREYQMRPQFFENTGNGAFVELEADSLGSFFRGKYLGRGLARLDWNGDGREDIVISHIEEPVALLTNMTPFHGHWLCLHLRGVDSARDAIGTTITVTSGGRQIVRQLTAGDGYQCSNQRAIVVGLGGAATADQVDIRWPSGRSVTFRDLRADMEYIVIEGRPDPISLD